MRRWSTFQSRFFNAISKVLPSPDCVLTYLVGVLPSRGSRGSGRDIGIPHVFQLLVEQQ